MNRWNDYRGLLKLAGTILLVPLIAWFLGFRQTFGIQMECNGLREKLERLYAGQKGKKEMMAMQNRLAEPALSNGAILERLTPVVKDNGVSVIKYTPFLTREEGKMQLYSGELILSGGYIPLLKVMKEMENNIQVGKIVSLAFLTEQNRETKERLLKMTLVIQQLTMQPEGNE